MFGLPNPNDDYKCDMCGEDTEKIGKFLTEGKLTYIDANHSCLDQSKDIFYPICSNKCLEKGVPLVKCYHYKCNNMGVFEHSIYSDVKNYNSMMSQFTFPACSAECVPSVKKLMDTSKCFGLTKKNCTSDM